MINKLLKKIISFFLAKRKIKRKKVLNKKSQSDDIYPLF